MMMRGTNDEEKMISPMFPRLHVNDTEKGGPRAPPRNKMALYEQLSIPSQRATSGSTSMLPIPHNSASTLVPSMSSSHVGGCGRNVFTPFSDSPAPSYSEKSLSHSSGGVKVKMANQERKSMNCSNGQSFNTSQPLSSSAKSNSFQSQNFLNFENFSWNKIGNENDLRVPGSGQSGAVLHTSSSQHSKDRENGPLWNLSFSMHFQNVSEKQKKGPGIVDLKTRESARNQTEEHRKKSEACQDPRERCASIPLIQGKTPADTSCSPSEKVKRPESLKRAHPLSFQEQRNSSVDVVKNLNGTNGQLDKDFVAKQDKTGHKDEHWEESARGIGKEKSSKVRSDDILLLLSDDNRSHNMIDNGKENHEGKQRGSLQVGNIERQDDISETSMVDSLSALHMSPDDVLRVIGEKQFWKARRVIVNQQRAFTVQVFELHRLMKVQQLIAGSPELLLEDKIYLGASLSKKVPSEVVIEQPPLFIKPKESCKKPYPDTEFADENTIAKVPLPSANNEISKGSFTQRSNYNSHSGGAPPAPMTTNSRPSSWCFPPPGNQWLVPVMSPSEGLVYKPYSGPCPPTARFMAPVYSNCGPMNLPGGVEDFMNAAYGIPASHQQGIGILPSNPHLGQAYFSPYGMRVMTPPVSGSAVEQVRPFTGLLSKDHNQLSFGDISSQMSRVVSCRVEKFQASKGSEVQRSTASSPFERPRGDALPLFPTEPTTTTAQASDQNVQINEQRTRVIKVVPLNPRSAPESAARIFRSIQEERNQYD